MQGVNLVKSDFCLFMNFLKNQGEKKFCRLNWFVADVVHNIRYVVRVVNLTTKDF